MDDQGIQTHTERFQKLIQEKRLDEVTAELFTLIDRGELTWDDVYRHFHFFPGLMNDPSLEDVYYCTHAPEDGEEPHHLESRKNPPFRRREQDARPNIRTPWRMKYADELPKGKC